MTETGVGHFGFSGFSMFAIVVGLLSLTIMAVILVRPRKSPLAFVVKPATAKRAVLFVVLATWLLLSAGCAATIPPLVVTGGPPQIPHTLEGRVGQCLVCHESGLAGAPKVPANHAGRTVDMCQLCHMPAVSDDSMEVMAASMPPTPAAPPAGGGMEVMAASMPPTPAAPPAGGDAAAAKALFTAKSCAACHGPDAQGGMGPNLKTPKREASLITTVVRSGKGAMPAFAQSQVSDAELQNIIAFLQAP